MSPFGSNVKGRTDIVCSVTDYVESTFTSWEYDVSLTTDIIVNPDITRDTKPQSCGSYDGPESPCFSLLPSIIKPTGCRPTEYSKRR